MQLAGKDISIRLLPGGTFRTITFLFFFLSQFILTGQDLDRQISLEVNNNRLKDVLDLIAKEGDVSFSYSSLSIPVDQKITYRCDSRSIRKVLNTILPPLGIEWLVVEYQIVLKRKKSGVSSGTATPARTLPSYVVSGYIRDKTTGEALIGANVVVRKSMMGTTTNTYGFYSLSLPQGIHEVEYSYLGFQEQTRSMDLQQNKEVSLEMEETSLGMREVVIRARDNEQLPAVNQPGDFNFSGATLEKLPGFAGDVDVLKALQFLPGIRSFGDGSSLFYVRGGNNDQNLLMIDEAPIYNPSHLFGFFSVLTPDAVNDMEIYKGDFPARFGGRTSSEIDITAREGNMKRFGFGGNLGP